MRIQFHSVNSDISLRQQSLCQHFRAKPGLWPGFSFAAKPGARERHAARKRQPRRLVQADGVFRGGCLAACRISSGSCFGCVSGRRPMIRLSVSAMSVETTLAVCRLLGRQLRKARLRYAAEPVGTVRWSHSFASLLASQRPVPGADPAAAQRAGDPRAPESVIALVPERQDDTAPGMPQRQAKTGARHQM